MDIPRGIEVLVKKAAVDAEFRELLIDRRCAAAHEIGLCLEPAEIALVNGIPEGQLRAIIDRTTVSPKLRPVFLGKAAVLMLAALGAMTLGCDIAPMPVTGSRPTYLDEDGKQVAPRPVEPAPTGSRPDVPKPKEDTNQGDEKK